MTTLQGKAVPIVAAIDVQQQYVKDAISWFQAKETIIDRQSYQAGHIQGWRDCLAWLTLHQYITRKV